MSEEDKKLQKHLVDEMMKVYETNPDVMLYMQALMENYEKLEQENKQLKNILTELEEWCKDGIKDELFKFDYGTKIIGEPIKIHVTSYEMVLDKIQELKEKYK